MKNRRRFYLMTGILFFVSIGAILIFNFRSQPATIGVSNGKLSQCPSSPNCVSSQTEQADKKMEPWKFQGTPDLAVSKLRNILESTPRTRIIKQTDTYLHAEVRSLVMRFVDDVEFLVDAENQQIHFRSASRVGHSDLGVNRARMLKIQQAFLNTE